MSTITHEQRANRALLLLSIFDAMERDEHFDINHWGFCLLGHYRNRRPGIPGVSELDGTISTYAEYIGEHFGIDAEAAKVLFNMNSSRQLDEPCDTIEYWGNKVLLHFMEN